MNRNILTMISRGQDDKINNLFFNIDGFISNRILYGSEVFRKV